MSKEILAQPDVWTTVEELAAKLEDRRTLDESALAKFFSGRTASRRLEYLQILFNFVNTSHARLVVQDYEEYKRFDPGSG
jgi:hypothetical protein